MMKIKSLCNKRPFVAILVVFFVSACGTVSPPRYSLNADTNMILRGMQGVSIAVVSVRDNSSFDATCRLSVSIEVSDNRNIAQFIGDSFNDEFKFAGIYGGSDSMNKLNLVLNRAAFSSKDGLTKGWWDLTITLRNARTGKSLQASTWYTFISGFEGNAACNQTANALTPAVQDLIKNVVLQKKFERLIGLE